MSERSPEMKAMFGGATSGGFFDLPRAAPGETRDADIILLGAPAATPYASVGNYCAEAPAAVRNAFGWPGVLAHHDFDIDGSLLPDGVQARVGHALDIGAVPLVLGGDDSVPIPVLEAYREHGPLTILQFDAHIDWRDQVGGERHGLSSNMRRASEMGWVENIIQVGARGIGSARPQDHRDALDWGVRFFPMRDIVANGMGPAIDSIPQGANLYLALDIDVMDPAVVPAVIGPAPGGFGYWQLVEVLEAAAQRARIRGFSLAELMPGADVNGRGALVAARLVAMVMGLVARQR